MNSTEEILEQFKINKLYGEKIPLARQAAISAFAREFVEGQELSQETRNQYLYQSVLANVCFQSALVRADLNRLMLLSDLIVFVKDSITTYLNQQNALNTGASFQALQKKDPTLQLLFEYVIALVPDIKIAEEVASDSAMFLLHEEEISQSGGDDKEMLQLEECVELFGIFSVHMVPAAVSYLESFYPECLEMYLESF